MAVTALTKTTAPGDAITAGTVLTMAAADAVNGNSFAARGDDLVIAYNSDASAHNVTITSVADDLARTGDITESIAAGAYRIYGPFTSRKGWLQSDGTIHISADNAAVYFGVVAL